MSAPINKELPVTNHSPSFKERLAGLLPDEPITKTSGVTDKTNPRIRQFFAPDTYNPDEFPFDTVDRR